MPQCNHIKKDGTQCGRVVPAGQNFCFQHGGPGSAKARSAAAPAGVVPLVISTPEVHLYALRGEQLSLLEPMVQLGLTKMFMHPSTFELMTLPLNITKDDIAHSFPTPITWDTVILDYTSLVITTKELVVWNANFLPEVLGARIDKVDGITLKEVVECCYRCKNPHPKLTIVSDDGKSLVITIV